MQMLSSTIPCPRCGADAMITLFGPTGEDVSGAELTFLCPDGHAAPADVTRHDLLEAWEESRNHHAGSRTS